MKGLRRGALAWTGGALMVAAAAMAPSACNQVWGLEEGKLAGGGAGAGGGGPGTDKCTTCAQASCGREVLACRNEPTCGPRFTCVDGCPAVKGATDVSCLGRCIERFPTGAGDALLACSLRSCKTVCGLGGIYVKKPGDPCVATLAGSYECASGVCLGQVECTGSGKRVDVCGGSVCRSPAECPAGSACPPISGSATSFCVPESICR